MHVSLVLYGTAIGYSSVDGEENQEFPEVDVGEILLFSDAVHYALL